MTDPIKSKKLLPIATTLRKGAELRTQEELSALHEYLQAQNIQFFQTLKPDQVLQMCKHMGIRQVGRGQTVCRAGDEGFEYFVILSGSVKVVTVLETEEPVEDVKEDPTLSLDVELAQWEQEHNPSELAAPVPPVLENETVLERGTGFGEVALLQDNALRTATVTALEPTVLLTLDKERYNIALKSELEVFRRKINFLKSHYLFRLMSHQTQLDLQYFLKERSFPRHSVIYREGDTPTSAFFVVEGEVMVRKLIVQESEDSAENTPNSEGISAPAPTTASVPAVAGPLPVAPNSGSSSTPAAGSAQPGNVVLANSAGLSGNQSSGPPNAVPVPTPGVLPAVSGGVAASSVPAPLSFAGSGTSGQTSGGGQRSRKPRYVAVRTLDLASLGAGGHFGEGEILDKQGARDSTVLTLSPVVLFELHRSHFYRFFRHGGRMLKMLQTVHQSKDGVRQRTIDRFLRAHDEAKRSSGRAYNAFRGTPTARHISHLRDRTLRHHKDVYAGPKTEPESEPAPELGLDSGTSPRRPCRRPEVGDVQRRRKPWLEVKEAAPRSLPTIVPAHLDEAGGNSASEPRYPLLGSTPLVGSHTPVRIAQAAAKSRAGKRSSHSRADSSLRSFAEPSPAQLPLGAPKYLSRNLGGAHLPVVPRVPANMRADFSGPRLSFVARPVMSISRAAAVPLQVASPLHADKVRHAARALHDQHQQDDAGPIWASPVECALFGGATRQNQTLSAAKAVPRNSDTEAAELDSNPSTPTGSLLRVSIPPLSLPSQPALSPRPPATARMGSASAHARPPQQPATARSANGRDERQAFRRRAGAHERYASYIDHLLTGQMQMQAQAQAEALANAEVGLSVGVTSSVKGGGASLGESFAQLGASQFFLQELRAFAARAAADEPEFDRTVDRREQTWSMRLREF